MSSIEVDDEVLKKILFDVRLLEGANIRTGEFSDPDMVKKIANIILKEANRGENKNEV